MDGNLLPFEDIDVSAEMDMESGIDGHEQQGNEGPGTGVGDDHLVRVGGGIRLGGDFHSASEIFPILHGAEVRFFIMVRHPVHGNVHGQGAERRESPIGVDEIRHFVFSGIVVQIMTDQSVDSQPDTVDEPDVPVVRLGDSEGDGGGAERFEAPQEVISRAAFLKIEIRGEGREIDLVDHVVDGSVAAHIKDVGDGRVFLQKRIQVFDFQRGAEVERNVVPLKEPDDPAGGKFGFGMI